MRCIHVVVASMTINTDFIEDELRWVRQRKNDTRSGEEIQIHILHIDRPMINVPPRWALFALIAVRDKERCGAPLMRTKLVAGLYCQKRQLYCRSLYIIAISHPSRAYKDVSTSILLALEKTIFAPDTAVLGRNER